MELGETPTLPDPRGASIRNGRSMAGGGKGAELWAYIPVSVAPYFQLSWILIAYINIILLGGTLFGAVLPIIWYCIITLGPRALTAQRPVQTTRLGLPPDAMRQTAEATSVTTGPWARRCPPGFHRGSTLLITRSSSCQRRW